MTTTRALTAIVASGLLLAACGAPTSGGLTPNPQPPPASSQQTTPQPKVVAPTPPPEPTTTVIPPGAFGKTFTWSDGLAVTVSPPTSYRASDVAAGAAKNNVVFTITLKNGTKDRYDPSGMYVRAADSQGDLNRIIDVTSDLMNDPTVSLRPGRTVTWRLAFALRGDSLKGLTVEVHPFAGDLSTGYETAIFEN